MSTITLQKSLAHHLDLPDPVLNCKEIEFIVRLSRRCLGESNLSAARDLIGGDLNWKYIFEAACFHGVFPAFYRNVKKHFWHSLPMTLANDLSLRNMQATHHTMALVGTFQVFHAELEKRNIRSSVFKGPALDTTAYGGTLLREFSDVDVLVAKDDVRKVEQILLDMGYSPAPCRQSQLLEVFCQSEKFLEVTSEQSFVRTSPSGLIDLHWQVQPRHVLPIETEDVLKTSVAINLENQQVRTIEPNLLLIVLAAHACRHSWKRLLWICDIAELIDSHQFDWQKIFSTSDRLGVTDMVVVSLMLANGIYGSAIPELTPMASKSKLEAVCLEIMDNFSVLDLGGHGSSLRHWRSCTRLKSGWFSKMRYLCTEFLKPNIADVMRLTLPDSLFLAYYILHPTWILYDAIARRIREQLERLHG